MHRMVIVARLHEGKHEEAEALLRANMPPPPPLSTPNAPGVVAAISSTTEAPNTPRYDMLISPCLRMLPSACARLDSVAG